MANGDTTAAPKKERKPRGPAKKRPVYIVYSTQENGDINIEAVTRKADEVLAATAGQADKRYARFEL